MNHHIHRRSFTVAAIRRLVLLCFSAALPLAAQGTPDAVPILGNLTIPMGGVWLDGKLGGHSG
jgi:hypothetical protein